MSALWKNGGAAIATVSNYLRINNFHAMVVGANGIASADVDLQGLAGGVIYHQVAVGGNMGLQCHYTVPAGYTMFITDWSGGVSGVKGTRLILRATADFDDRVRLQTGLFHFQDIMVMLSNDAHRIFPSPLLVPEKCDVKVSGNGIGGTAEASASFGFWIES